MKRLIITLILVFVLLINTILVIVGVKKKNRTSLFLGIFLTIVVFASYILDKFDF